MGWLARLLSAKKGGPKLRALLEAAPEESSGEAPSAQAAPQAGASPAPAPDSASGSALDAAATPAAPLEQAAAAWEAPVLQSREAAGTAAVPSGVLLKRPPRAYEDRIRPVAFRTDPIPLVTVPKRLFKNETTPCLPWEADASGRVVLGGDGALREAERRVQAKFSGMAPGADEAAPLTDAEVCWSDEDEAAEAAVAVKPVRTGQLLFDFAEQDPEPVSAPKTARSGR